MFLFQAPISMILCNNSFEQLKAMFKEFEDAAKHSIEDGLKKKFSGDLLNCFNSIVKCVKDKQGYNASLLYKSMHGLGTDESKFYFIFDIFNKK